MIMSKIKIKGSEFSDTDLKFSVCSHLLPILDYLVKNGNSWDKGNELFTDKGGTRTLFVHKTIDYSKIEKIFEIPPFIEVNREYKSIICRRCWCDISER